MNKLKNIFKSKKGTVPVLAPFIAILLLIIASIIYGICHACGVF